jgi:tyrosine-protein kinase Etk/Wzc
MPTDESYSPVREAVASGVAAHSVGEDPKDEVYLLDVLIALAERKRTIFLITAAFAILAIAISLILPESYTATLSLLPPQQNSSIMTGLAAQLGNLSGMASLAGGSLGLKNSNDMYVAMLKSRTVEDAVVQRFDLMKEYKKKYQSEARGALEHHSVIDGSNKDNLIRVSVKDHDPNRAAELANGYVEQFRKLSEHLAITEASQRRLFFEQQLEHAKDNLANAEDALKRTEQKTGLIELNSQAMVLIESAAALRAQIAAKEVQIQSLRTFAASENSQLMQAQQELEGLRAQLSKLGGSGDGSDATLMMPKGRVTEAGLEYVRKFRDVKYYETIFEILARQFETAKLDEAKQGALIQVVDAAVPPDRRSFPKRGLIVIGATLVGFLIGLLTAMAQSAYQHMQETPELNRKLFVFRRALSFKR